MASAALRDELTCPICLEVYADPVTLRCGHNFCRACINDVLESQRSRGGFNCPQCRTRFKRRPCLQKNVTLANIAEHFRSSPADGATFCTYCIHVPAPAVKSCLHCEASLCADHLRVHSDSPEHLLIEPSSSLDDWKCPAHKKVLEYYCAADGGTLCALCVRDEGEHRGHEVQPVAEAARKKMERVKDVLAQLVAKRRENEALMKALRRSGEEAPGAGARLAERAAALFHELRERLNALEVQAAEAIGQQVKGKTKSIHEQTDLLEIKNHIMSLNIGPMQDFCRVTDPMAILKDRQWNVGEKKGDGVTATAAAAEVEFLDDVLLSLQLQRNVAGVFSCVPDLLHLPKSAGLAFDRKTAAANVTLSSDSAIAYGAQEEEEEDVDERPDSRRVFGTSEFFFGRHYWEAELSDAGGGGWRVGVAYNHEDEDDGEESSSSWCLCQRGRQGGYFFRHGGKEAPIARGNGDERIKRLGIYVDFDRGRISFYDMGAAGEEVRHVHTAPRATFTEPLYAAVWVGGGAWVKII